MEDTCCEVVVCWKHSVQLLQQLGSRWALCVTDKCALWWRMLVWASLALCSAGSGTQGSMHWRAQGWMC